MHVQLIAEEMNRKEIEEYFLEYLKLIRKNISRDSSDLESNLDDQSEEESGMRKV